MNQARAKVTLDIIKRYGAPNAVATTRDFENYAVEFLADSPRESERCVRWWLEDAEDVLRFLEEMAES